MKKEKLFIFGRETIIACDCKCNKAWGINSRPKEYLDDNNPDDYCYIPDGELEEAPKDPGTSEGGDKKEPLSFNKWCIRECERLSLYDPKEEIV